LYEGFKQRKKNIEIPVNTEIVSPKDIADIAVSVYNDTPSFYYLDVRNYSYARTPFGYIYSQNYIYSDQKIREYDRQLEILLNNFRSKFITPQMFLNSSIKFIKNIFYFLFINRLTLTTQTTLHN
jgi:hypothetical protein